MISGIVRTEEFFDVYSHMKTLDAGGLGFWNCTKYFED